VLQAASADLETLSRQAIFSVNANLKRAYFVLLVEKAMQGDLNSVSEVYINAKVGGLARSLSMQRGAGVSLCAWVWNSS
jgi:hypothetical protein